jgi:hypothetical protein
MSGPASIYNTRFQKKKIGPYVYDRQWRNRQAEEDQQAERGNFSISSDLFSFFL